MNPGGFEGTLSFDPFERYWLTAFTRKYGERFQHKAVWTKLFDILQGGSLYGINRIYDDNQLHLDRIDKITPLLKQMQDDILHEMFQHPELEEIVFPKDGGHYWFKRLRVLFERYYGPRGLVAIQDVAIRTSHLRMDDQRLDFIRRLIERGATEGERNAAKAAWKRITGKSF